MTENNLYFSKDCYLYVIEATNSEITNWGWAIANEQPPRTVVRFLRGKKMKKIASLFDEFAAALQFPYYFGENWNAFRDCIIDLDWLPGSKYIFIITESEQILAEEPLEQFESLVTILQEAGEEWGIAVEDLNTLERSAEFYVLFQCLRDDKIKITSRLKAVKADFQT